MAMSLNKWTDSIKDLLDFADANPEKMFSEKFLRDPFRTSYINKSYFYSPADGIILYQKILKPDEKLAEVKGINYNLMDMMEDQTFDKTCLVIGIFMSYACCHINRIPLGGYLSYRLLSPTATYNRPMIFVEKSIFKNRIKDAYKNMNYIKTNARMLNTIYNPVYDLKYYITQIGDEEVNLITPFTPEQNLWFNQNERFSMIRWGSQVELIIPIDNRYKYTTLIPNLFHVCACEDRLVKIEKK